MTGICTLLYEYGFRLASCVRRPNRSTGNVHHEADADYFPKRHESSFKIVTVPGRAARASMAGRMPSVSAELRSYFDADDPEMHTTDTIDYVVILAGSADLELELGRKETVQAGDCVVQRGTRHAWRVTSEEPLVLCAVLFGARRQ